MRIYWINKPLHFEPPFIHWAVLPVASRGWEQLCDPREPAINVIVREFYANVLDHKDKKVHVRGKKVPFDGKNNQ